MRICEHCATSIGKASGFYGFGYFEELTKGGDLHWFTGLYEAGNGPQQPRRKADMAVRFDVCTSCLIPFLQKHMPSLRAQQKHKGERPDLRLPDNLKLSAEETAAAVRLARLMRINTNWLGFFIQWLLQRDAESTYDLPVKEVEDMLNKMKNLETWISYLEDLKKDVPAISRHRAVAWVPPKGQDAVVPEREDEQFGELVRIWRLQHPEPQKRIVHPTGHLGREESGD